MSALAETIEAHLAESGSASCDAVAKALARRRRDVLTTLRDDPRFVRSGRGRWSQWQLVSDAAGDGYGTDGNGLLDLEPTSDTVSTRDAGEGRTTSRCSDPGRHAGNRAHYRTGDGRKLCIVCDPTPEPPPLTFREWADGLGGEDRRHRFEADYAALISGEVTPGESERMRQAFAGVV